MSGRGRGVEGARRALGGGVMSSRLGRLEHGGQRVVGTSSEVGEEGGREGGREVGEGGAEGGEGGEEGEEAEGEGEEGEGEEGEGEGEGARRNHLTGLQPDTRRAFHNGVNVNLLSPPAADCRRKKRHGRRTTRKKRWKGEDGELMFEMEEGGHRSSSTSSGNSSEMDRQYLGHVHGSKSARRLWFGKLALIHVVIFAAFSVLLFAAHKASRGPDARQTQNRLSNGTSTFAPTTILISLDGFRADFLHRNITPNLAKLIQSGVSPLYMLPSFPSLTFPNHFTLVTGLHPESHGVVGNTFWDPHMQKEFYYTDPARSMQPEWWPGEPLWVTAENHGVRTAIHMWPGSEAYIGGVEPAYVDKFDDKEPLSHKVDRVLELLDLPGPDDVAASEAMPRPQLIAAYVPNVDADGHAYGPNSTEIKTTISDVDSMLGDLLAGLDQRNLTHIVNVVVVSDHGMATTSTDRLVQLDDIIDMSLIAHTDGWPLYGLRPHEPEALVSLYNVLKAEAAANGNYDVYLRDKDMPQRYHFSNHDRIAPLWVVPKTGWAIATKDDFDVEEAKKEGKVYHPRGLHGYDHEHPLMRAIFVAHGPAFPHQPGSRVEVFQNIEVYNIVCDSIGVAPKANNGTLRLPLRPVGMHDGAPPAEVPDDPPRENDQAVDAAAALLPASPASTNAQAAPTRPIVHDGLSQDEADEGDKGINLSWEWVTGKLDGLKVWATGVSEPDDKGGRERPG
ncbi:hypothetical protein LTR66_011171 [Elasticomyces elasticus]|nr:hypothetical protein LTR66_011171 [Elasticomyces elasticus]